MKDPNSESKLVQMNFDETTLETDLISQSVLDEGSNLGNPVIGEMNRDEFNENESTNLN